MITTIEAGTAFVVRDRGALSLFAVCEGQRTYSGVKRPLQAGETVHRAVWKRADGVSRLESRESYVLKPGDAEWYDTGINGIDFTKPVSAAFGHAESTKTIHKNRFVRGPSWLREAD